MTRGSKDFWLTSLRTEAAAFRQAVATPDAWTRAVPSCPDWTVADLAHHLSEVYHWVRMHVNRGVISAPDHAGESAPPAGTLAWFDEQRADLLAVLDAVDPELPAWNWAPQAKKAAFWLRRMALETAVHRWDAQLAVGRPEPIESPLAADGVAEVVDTWLPAGRRTGPTDRSGLVHLTATDIAGATWYVRLRDEGVALLDTRTLFDDDELKERVTAAGTASDLLLALMNRIPFDVLDVSGDAALLECLLTGGPRRQG